MSSLIVLMGLAHLISALPGGAQITDTPLARKDKTPVKRDDVCGRQWQPECFLGTWSAGPGERCPLNNSPKGISG